MHLDVAYQDRSRLIQSGSSGRLAMQPNLHRDEVALDAALRDPLAFREAMSALHEIVTSNHKPPERDRTAYQAWKREQVAADHRAEQAAADAAVTAAGLPPSTVAAHDEACGRYWKARTRYDRQLRAENPALWRILMPCDPVVTVAEDVVFFECFSADESSYGCLTLDRDAALESGSDGALGTTNVDYSQALFEAFQSLRSYRQTRLQVDPAGFGVVTERGGGHREEKIDLPDGWLRGFLQVQTAMAMPLRRVPIDRDCLYSLLAFQRRHRARRSPRDLRIELTPGQSPQLTLHPWGRAFVSRGTRYDGPPADAPVRLWGTRRLLALARTLPLVRAVDLYLLGDGLPAFWVLHLPGMRLTLGLSGWTANDWTGGSALDALRPPIELEEDTLRAAAAKLRSLRSIPRPALAPTLGLDEPSAMAAVDTLAARGQVIFDLADGEYRWRSILPGAVERDQLAINPEVRAAQRLRERVTGREVTPQPDGGSLVRGVVEHHRVVVELGPDRTIRGGECECSHHFRSGLKRGPCRHLIALRDALPPAPSLEAWWARQRAAR